MLSVFLDANIFKFSATSQVRMFPRESEINWGGVREKVTVHDIRTINPNDYLENEELKYEASLLEKLASMGHSGLVKYYTHAEAEFETWNLPRMGSKTGRFYRAPISEAKSPIEYSRIFAQASIDSQQTQYAFLSALQDKRFLDIQKIVGAYQGKSLPNRNQLLDAFHIWCAESNNIDYFLTMDFKLAKVCQFPRNTEKLGIKVVKPSQLLKDVVNTTAWGLLVDFFSLINK